MAKKEKEISKKQKGHYFKDMKAELKKVIWPTPKQLVNNTIAIIAFTLVIALIVFLLDLGFEAINKNGITAMQEKIISSYSASENENTENTNTEGGEETSNTTEENSTNEVEENVTEVNVVTDSEE